MSGSHDRNRLRGTLAVAVLFTGLAAAKGMAVATPTTVQPIATSGSATMSSNTQPVVATGSSDLPALLLAPLMNALFGCSSSACPTGRGAGVG